MAVQIKPFDAYRGDGVYVFVSYAHADADQVYQDLVLLKGAGLNVYYDDGITPGSRWTSELADAIENCALFIAFLSPAAVASENCANEIEFAVSRKRPMLAVHLQAVDIPPGLELSLGSRQAILKHNLESDVYQAKFTDAARTMIAGGQTRLAGTRVTRSPSHRRMWLALTVVLVMAAAYLTSRYDRAPPTPDLRVAIAVRPFATDGVQGSDGAFLDGIADDLIMRLDRSRSLPVIARGSSFNTSLPVDPSAAGRALNARYLVDGIVHRGDNAIDLTVYLVDASDGRNVWSKKYSYAPGEVMNVQADIADAIVTEINPALVDAESRRALRADPNGLDAWSAAMRGWWHLNAETEEGLLEAQRWFNRAAEMDPAWSWPHSALALSAYRSIINGWSTDIPASIRSLSESSNRAVQLDARDAFAHHALGHAYALQGRIDESLTALARGVELSPNDAMANGCFAMQLAASARSSEAIDVINHAMSISPDDPWLHRFALVRARAHFAAAQYADAEQWALRSQQLQPNSGAFLHSVAAPALGDGLERARKRAADARAVQPLPPLARIEQNFIRSTDPDYVHRLLEGLRRAGFE